MHTCIDIDIRMCTNNTISLHVYVESLHYGYFMYHMLETVIVFVSICGMFASMQSSATINGF